jgi:hypothetical protein
MLEVGLNFFSFKRGAVLFHPGVAGLCASRTDTNRSQQRMDQKSEDRGSSVLTMRLTAGTHSRRRLLLGFNKKRCASAFEC